MRVSIVTTAWPAEELRLADAAINARTAAVDYGGDGARFVIVKVLPKAPRGRKLAVKRGRPRTFADHVQIEVLAGAERTARALIELTASAIAGARPTHGLDLARAARDVRRAARDLPLASIEEVERANDVRYADGDEARRRRLRRPLRRALGGVRAYEVPALDDVTGTEQCLVVDLFADALRAEGVRTPGYAEIYVNVAGSLDDAKRHRAAIEDWHENAYAAIDVPAYRRADPAQRIALLMDAFGDAFLRLAQVDRLDRAAIRRAIATVRARGVEAELAGPGAENATHRAQVRYRLDPDGRTGRFVLAITDKRTKARRDHDLGTHALLWWPYRFAKVTLTRQVVRVDAGKSERADVYLKDTPRRIELRLR